MVLVGLNVCQLFKVETKPPQLADNHSRLPVLCSNEYTIADAVLIKCIHLYDTVSLLSASTL